MSVTYKPVPEWLVEYESEVIQVPITRISKEQLLNQLKTNPEEVAVVDLRNEQEDKGAINKALHIPATLINGADDIEKSFITPIKEQQPTAKKIVLFCNRSGKRPDYVGGWAKAYLEKEGREDLEVTILDHGITGWIQGGEEFKDETTYYPAVQNP